MLEEQNTPVFESQEFLSDYLLPSIENQTRFGIDMHQASSSSRRLLEDFILQKYKSSHSATLRTFMPRLVSLTQDFKIVASIGIRGASEGALFLEQYIEDPIEIAVSSYGAQTETRKNIVELGNFAAKNIRCGSLLFTLLAQSLNKSGFKWMTFTATTEIEKMINRLGCKPTILSEAKVEKIDEDENDWGDYYLKAPKVMACNLEETLSAAYTSRKLNTIFKQYQAETASLARSLRVTNNQDTR